MNGRAEKRHLPDAPVPSPFDTGRRNSYLAIAVCGFLLLAIALVYGQTVRHEFVNFDDDEYIYENPKVAQGVTVEGIAWACTTGHAGNWHPLTWLSHMLDCQLYGLKWPGGHHLTNVLLHAASTIVLFLVLRQMTGELWPSAFVAAVFAIHPLHVESVAWVAERKDVLSGLFFMLTSGRLRPICVPPILAWPLPAGRSLYALGLMAKPMLVTLPFVLLLLDYWPLGRFSKDARADQRRSGRSTAVTLVVEKLHLAALAAVSCVVTLWAQREAVHSAEDITFPSRIANALVSYVSYLGQLFYPAGLAVLYPHPGNALPAWIVVGAFLLLAAIFGGVLVWRRKYPYLFVGWLWYVGMLVPVIGLVQVGAQSQADRYTYLTQIGLYIALAWGASDMTRHWSYRPWVCGVTSAIVLMLLAACAWRQTAFWHDSEALWTHTLACTTRNATAHNNLGRLLADQGRYDEAIRQLQKALEIDPDLAVAHGNLGYALADRGQVDEAIAEFQTAMKIDPDDATTHYNLGLVLADRGQLDEAIAHFRKALEINPDYVKVHGNLGLALAHRGQVDEAIAEYRKALELDPDGVRVHNDLGLVLAQRGQVDEAIIQFRKALELKPDCAEFSNNLGLALTGRGQVDEAIVHFKKALELRPRYADAHNNLGIALTQLGQLDAAIVHFRKALEITPDYATARTNLTAVLAEREKLKKSEKDAR